MEKIKIDNDDKDNNDKTQQPRHHVAIITVLMIMTKVA